MMHRILRKKLLLGLLAGALAVTACGTDGDDGAADGGAADGGAAEEAQDIDASDWDPPASADMVVHTGPGGGSDVFARQISQMLYDEGFTDNPWPVENVEGGSGATAMAHMMQEGGNDETIAAITMTWIATSITTEGAVDIRDLTPIAQVLTEPTFIVARADAPFDDFDEMIEWAEDNPGQLNVSGGSVTSHASIVANLMQEETDTEWRFVSFPGGGERISAMLSGDTDIMYGSLQDFEQYIRDGSLKWIVSIEEERADFLDEVPTVRELGYDIEVLEQVRGIVGPPEMSADAVAGYQETIREFTETEAWLDYVEENGWMASYAPADEFGQTIDQLTERLSEILADVDVDEDEA